MRATDRRSALAAVMAGGVALSAGAAQAAPRPGRSDAAGQLDMLVSRAQIHEVVLAYARGNDRNDPAMIRACFWPESTHSHGRFQGSSSEFVGFATKILDGLKFSAHHISNISIEVAGNRALSECYYFAHHRRPTKDGAGEEDAFFEGRYIDAFERRAGVWKIIRRRGLSDWNSTALPAASLYSSWPAGQHSLRGADRDDYYTLLEQFRAGR